MQKTQKLCSILSHEEQTLRTLCVYDYCDYKFRWLCDRCVEQNLHDHKLKNQDHLLNQEQLIAFILKFLQQNILYLRYNKQQTQECIKNLKQIIQSISREFNLFYTNKFDFTQNPTLQKIFQYLLHKLNYVYEKSIILIGQLNQDLEMQLHLINTTKKVKQIMDFQQFSNDQINEMLQRSQNLKYSDYGILVEDIKKTYQSIMECKINSSLNENMGQAHYENYLSLKSQSNYSLNISQISPDEKYLIFQENQTLRVKKLSNKKNYKILFMQKYYFTFCQFSNDSKLLICGISNGCLMVYSVILGFKQIQKIQAHELWVYIIKIFNNKIVISCSVDGIIIVTDIGCKKQLLKIKTQNGVINSIDYNNMIVSGSSDDDITLYNSKNGEIIFSQTINQAAVLVLFMKDNLICCDTSQVKLWKICDNQFILLQQVESEHRIYNASLVHDNTKIIMITQINVRIFDDELQQLQIVEYQISPFIFDFFNEGYFDKNKQPNSMKYILINLKGKRKRLQIDKFQILKLN